MNNLDALRRGLRELGYVENQNLVLEYRSADGDARNLPALADDLVRLGVDLIVTRGTPAARAAKNATETIPIVMAAIGELLGVVGIDGLIQVNRQLIADLAAKQRLAAIYPSKEFVDVGGLMAYGVSYPDLYFRSATFIDKIFGGAKAGDLPVEQPTKLELIINLKAAKALGLDVPPTLVARADEVTE
jgi:ABC-type uncharacterized transport system substrate-binding protein